MRKTLVVLATALVVGAGVWYLASYAPLEQSGQTPPPAPGAPTRTPAPKPAPAPSLGPACGGHCGAQRWAVKTLSDADRAEVNFTPVDATVEQLAALPVASPPPGHERAVPVEVTTYRVEASLTRVFTEDDHDWHLVLHGLQDTQASVIAEIPDPQCAGACRSGAAGGCAGAWGTWCRREEMLGEVFGFRLSVVGVDSTARVAGQRGPRSDDR